mmetsp:Transcript_70989/g.156642  ORF Transcript_70989/g.156642 Transcript_70989/m.156642 type:complete len:288 (+) Transcript_70989:590-1453(+)
MRKVPLFASDLLQSAAVAGTIMWTNPLSSHPAAPKQDFFFGAPWIPHDSTSNFVVHHTTPNSEKKLVRKAHQAPSRHRNWPNICEDWHSKVFHQKVLVCEKEVQVLWQQQAMLKDSQSHPKGVDPAIVKTTCWLHLQVCLHQAYSAQHIASLLKDSLNVLVSNTRPILRQFHLQFRLQPCWIGFTSLGIHQSLEAVKTTARIASRNVGAQKGLCHSWKMIPTHQIWSLVRYTAALLKSGALSDIHIHIQASAFSAESSMSCACKRKSTQSQLRISRVFLQSGRQHNS